MLVADKDNSIKPGTRVVNQWQLGRALTGELELDPPIKALCVYNCNPVTQSAEQDKIVAGLGRGGVVIWGGGEFLRGIAGHCVFVLPFSH